MKILYLYCSTNYSGAEIVMERLTSNNKEVTPFVICPPGDFADRLEIGGFKIYRINALTSLNRDKVKYSRFKLVLIVLKKIFLINYAVYSLKKKLKVDIFHANNLAAAVYLLPSIWLRTLFFRRKKFIWSNHDISYPDGRKSDKLAIRCIKHFDLTIAVSNAVKNKFLSYSNKITVLYNGLDLEKYKPNLVERGLFRENNLLRPDDIAIGIVGLISERKGQVLLIEAIKEMVKEHLQVKLYIIGKYNPSEEDYGLQIKELIDQNSYIKHIPFTENIIEVYNGLDIIVNCSLPGLSEPLGTTIYEAMACGKLVVASNTGGTPEIINDNFDGILFEAGDLNDLIAKLNLAINHQILIDKIKINCRNTVVKKFSIDNMINNYNDLINKI